ncbi:MAG TPA: DMT family transporter [Vicinamibacterales bacterium]|nr:DMT family transporter [Vicinamibacterales bacterium]
MFVVLSLASAVCYGAADFLGGLTSKRASTIPIVVLSQFSGLALLFIMLPLVPAAAPSRVDHIWGAIAGLTGGVGVALLYRALSIGVMAVVAPTTAVCAVTIPVLAAVVMGERPGIVRIAGIGLAIVAIALVSQSNHPEPGDRTQAEKTGSRTSAFSLALLSGVVIGFFFLALAQTSERAGLWPLVTARLVSVALFASMLLMTSTPRRIPKAIVGTVIAGGALDMVANLLYMIATRSGPLSVVVTLASLYPASTVILARVVLHERLSPTQWVGVVCALIAVVAIVR